MSSAESPPDLIAVFRGPLLLCQEFGLVLEARGIAYQLLDGGDAWALAVVPPLEWPAREELQRYDQERKVTRPSPPSLLPFGGAAYGAIAYSAVLLLIAWCAGADVFGTDWYARGALLMDPEGGFDPWRAFTALTLHVDALHLFSNLLFGIGVGMVVSRVFGPGIAWASILGAGAFANAIEMLIAPLDHRAVGASTAVFAALGILSGFGWRLRADLKERRLYRWAPLIAGICLLTLLGAGGGTEHVDVLGHLLGFLAGVLLGWTFARAGMPRTRSTQVQMLAGAAALLALGIAWAAALGSSVAP
jgi:rhomboid protease GluP